jgi:hypothetical protein
VETFRVNIYPASFLLHCDFPCSATRFSLNCFVTSFGPSNIAIKSLPMIATNILRFALKFAVVASACIIQNNDSGVCTYKYTTSSKATLEQIEAAKQRWEEDLPFCGHYVHYYPVCVPAASSQSWSDQRVNLFVSSDEKEDKESIKVKDKWVQEYVSSTIATKIDQERSLGKSHYHYYRNKDCRDAFAAFTCWLNFPRCDEFQESLPMCQSPCENMFRVCGFDLDLWRCNEDIVDGDDEWNLRAFFPGQPFRKNEFERGGEPKVVCTPSIKGSADTWAISFTTNAVVASFVMFLLLQ